MADQATKSLHVTVITPARAVYDAQAKSVVVPAFDGEMGVLPGHAAILALLGTGEVRVTSAEGNIKKLAIRGGFLQVNRNNVTVLTPESLAGEEVKADAVQGELKKLDNEKPTKLDERDAHDAKRAWAKARLKLTTGSAK